MAISHRWRGRRAAMPPTRRRPSRRGLLGTVATYAALTAVSLVMLTPLYLMILIALRPESRAFAYPPDLWPTGLTPGNFPRALFELAPFPQFFRNTLLIATLVIIGDLISCSLVAYGFACFRFPGRDALFVVLLGTLMAEVTS